MADDSPALLAILEKAGSGDSEKSSGPAGSDLPPGLEVAASEMMSAVKSGDSKSLAKALRNALKMCK